MLDDCHFPLLVGQMMAPSFNSNILSMLPAWRFLCVFETFNVHTECTNLDLSAVSLASWIPLQPSFPSLNCWRRLCSYGRWVCELLSIKTKAKTFCKIGNRYKIASRVFPHVSSTRSIYIYGQKELLQFAITRKEDKLKHLCSFLFWKRSSARL
jgi:hypothetical protein